MSNWLAEGPVGRDWFGLDHFRPGPRFLRDGGELYLLDEVESTNDFLRGRGGPAPGRRCLWDGWGWKGLDHRRLDPVTDPRPGTIVAAHRQTAGKGRQGRRWQDCGGLNLSVVVPPHRATFDQGFAVWLGLITVMALRDVLQVDARLKWPNDLMVGARKLGGILLERVGRGDRKRVVAGLGLNLHSRRDGFPPELRGRATSIRAETGRRVMAAQAADAVIGRVEAELDRFRAEGWGPYRDALDYLDALLGREVTVRRGPDAVSGRVEGIDDHGALLLRSGGGRVDAIGAGDVHLETLPGSESEEEAGLAGPGH